MATGDDDSGEGGSSVSDEAADERREQLAEERLTEEVRDAARGILARYPAEWKQEKRSGLIMLESGDRCVSITLAAPKPAGGADALLDDTVAAVKRNFPGAQVERGAGQRVGGLAGSAAVLEVKNPDGDPVRVLITVGRGERFAYLTQVVLRDPACGDALVDSQLVVNSISYSK